MIGFGSIISLKIYVKFVLFFILAIVLAFSSLIGWLTR